jgi:hypothetical protein
MRFFLSRRPHRAPVKATALTPPEMAPPGPVPCPVPTSPPYALTLTRVYGLVPLTPDRRHFKGDTVRLPAGVLMSIRVVRG